MAVCGPAGVADAIRTVEWITANYFFQVLQLAGGAANLQPMSVACDRDARGIITAVFEALETVQNDVGDLFTSYVTYDATHMPVPASSSLSSR
jgi:hypothetical protein